MQTTSFKHVAYLIECCTKNGIADAVISPGSRNAPIITALESHPQIETHLIADERSAAFIAIGIAEATQKAVVLSCTSGSALLNYAPAIVEAYYRQIPLLVLTADRPVELIDQGDGQTMRQSGVYENYSKSSFDLPNHDIKQQFECAKKTVEKAIVTLLSAPNGPVHLNIPLEEPLYDTADFSFDEVFSYNKENVQKRDYDLEELSEKWQNSEKKMLIVGQLEANNQLKDVVKQLASDPSVAVLVENTSNILDFQCISHSIDRSLATIAENELEKFAPDLLISVGGAVISKRIKAYLRKYKPSENWVIGKYLIQKDTFQSATKFIRTDAKEVLSQIASRNFAPTSNYGGKWKQKDLLAQEIHKNYINTLPLCDLKVYDVLMETLPPNTILHMGNSSVVRYCQLFNPIFGTSYLGNRGVSGIDGSTSTAIGYALKNPNSLNVLVSGDISFFYDSNAFWNNKDLSNFKLIVISNGGGGIFQIIPGPASSNHSETFFAPTKAKINGICEAFNVNYSYCNKLEHLENKLVDLFKVEENNRPSVLEIDTRNINNAAYLENYFKALQEAQ